MKITATQTFLHGTDRYEEGEEYDVDSGLAAYFVNSGWAEGTGKSPATQRPQDVTLDIESASHGVAGQEA